MGNVKTNEGDVKYELVALVAAGFLFAREPREPTGKDYDQRGPGWPHWLYKYDDPALFLQALF